MYPDMAYKFSYRDLARIRLRAFRSYSWRRLSMVERALFRACVELAKLRGSIVNPSLVKRLESLVSRLLNTPGRRILQLGRDYASHLLGLYARNGLVGQFPSIRNLLKDPEYLFWLGVKQLAVRNFGIGVRVSWRGSEQPQ
jgi:hypothetical protein